MEMIFSLPLTIGLSIVLLAFFAEYIDSTLGMGYGTSLTPILLIMGFEPMQIVPCVLFSELVTGFLAGFTHHAVGNIDIMPKTMNIVRIYRGIKAYGFSESFKKGIPDHLKIILLIGSCSVIGTVFAIAFTLNISKYALSLYISVLILLIGFVILLTINKNYGFSWKKIIFLSTVASFNKGVSGGGYGPVVTGGQVLSGIEGKNAVGITSMAEALTCLVGVISYVIFGKEIDFTLAPYLMIGALASVPLSAISVKIVKTKHLRIAIGLTTLVLGFVSIIKTLN